ncbi:HoxN/HupN/NixA family nickel/cobalt transporter [Thiolapillus sp.]
MGSILLLGFIIGMRHALDADHVAAVATLVSGRQSLRQTLRQGWAWGLGHALTLLVFGSAVLFLDTAVPEQVAAGLEFAVGIMLLVLGLDLLRRLIRQRIHFHFHKHADGARHFHAHSHEGEPARKHDSERHEHQHPEGFPMRAMLVGTMHGMAGSAAVILLVLQTMDSGWLGLLYILTFGVGSILGMSLLSMAISIPMRLSARSLTWAYNGLQFGVAMLNIGLGLFIAHRNIDVPVEWFF